MVPVHEAEEAVRMLQHMGDDKIKEEVDALSARSDAAPISLVTMPLSNVSFPLGL